MERIVIENRVIEVMGDHVDTDVISPTQYVSLFEEAEVAKHVFEFYAPSFRDKARAGGILVAGANFGCGSAREQAATGLKGAGVELILARSCSRSFYRNAVNVGLPVVEVDNLPEGFAGEGDRVRVDLAAGLLENRSAGRSLSFAPPHPFVLAVMRAGGIFAFYEATGNYRNLDHLGESPLITQ